MNTPVKSFQIIETVQNVLTQVQTSSFQVWPILNSKGRIIGTINKQTLIAMVEHDCWYYPEESMPQVEEEKKEEDESMEDDLAGKLTYSRLSEQHDDEEDEYEFKNNPKSNCLLSFADLTKDYISSQPDYMKHIDKFYQNKDKQLDMRPYMVPEPCTVDLKDS